MMEEYVSKFFWLECLERAVKTAAQTAIATIGTATMLNEVDWLVVASTVALATVLSVLTSVASGQVGQPGSPSLVARHMPAGGEDTRVCEGCESVDL